MTIATTFPDQAVKFVKTLADSFETDRVEEMSAEEASWRIRICAVLRDVFAQARRSFEDRLSQGVDAKVFAAQYEQTVADLELILAVTQETMRKAQQNLLPPPAAQFVASFTALMDDLLSLHQFLAGVVATAQLPHRPVDWKRVQEAKAAYAKGEMKPFQRSSKG